MANPDGATYRAALPASDGRVAATPIVETLKADTDALADEAKNVLGQVSDEAAGQISRLADQAKERVAEAGDKVKGLAAEQKDLLAEQVGNIADAMDRVAGDLEASNSKGAYYARVVADNAGQFASTIRDNDVDQIMATAQDFGRRQPGAFLGAAALLGFAASRFLLASAKRAEQPQTGGPGQVNGASGGSAYEPGRM